MIVKTNSTVGAWEGRTDIPEWEKDFVLDRLKDVNSLDKPAAMIRIQDELSAERRARAEAARIAVTALSEPEPNSDQ